MELRDFVAETIKQIVDGVKIAQEYGKQKGARVNPLNLSVRDNEGKSVSTNYRGDVERAIEFDVAVTTTEGSGTKGGLAIVVGPVVLGSQGKKETGSHSMSRIKFSIPIVLPIEK